MTECTLAGKLLEKSSAIILAELPDGRVNKQDGEFVYLVSGRHFKQGSLKTCSFCLKTCSFCLKTCSFCLKTCSFCLKTCSFCFKTCSFCLKTRSFCLKTCSFCLAVLPGGRFPLCKLSLPGHARFQARGEDSAQPATVEGRHITDSHSSRGLSCTHLEQKWTWILRAFIYASKRNVDSDF